jgi:hypothetical protein
MRDGLVLLTIFLALSSGFGAEASMDVSGSAVAVSVVPTSLNTNVYAEILVRTADKGVARMLRSEFVVVRVSVPESSWHQWLNALSRHDQFRLRVSRIEYAPLKERLNTVTPETTGAENTDVPAWRILPGKESIVLPFGETVPSCESDDWPVVPII